MPNEHLEHLAIQPTVGMAFASLQEGQFMPNDPNFLRFPARLGAALLLLLLVLAARALTSESVTLRLSTSGLEFKAEGSRQ
jgi:hypothetical protein